MNKKQHPIIETDRLILRPFELDDAPVIRRFIGDWDVSNTLQNVPYPYEDGMAETWIKTSDERFKRGESLNFAITHQGHGKLIGSIGISIDGKNERGELGYWIGKPYWGNGYCSEAALEVVKYGFQGLELNRIYAMHMTRNPASGRVMQKIGMVHEGRLRQHAKVHGIFEDYDLYGILGSEYMAPR
ncbi:GNAT family N-acetyltransferase [Chloroflexota bacterium]